MKSTLKDLREYVREEDVKFIRLAFCDLQGHIKNAAIMPDELERAFREGITFDGSAVKGFETPEKSDLFLYPDLATLTALPWRPSHGRVIRLFCAVKTPDGKPYELDMRGVLKKAIEYAKERGIFCDFGTEFEFYLFKLDEDGNKTDVLCDEAGYMDVAPKDKGENVRREICLAIEEMGLYPERSHHEEGFGQNEIDFRYSDALSSADHAVIFKNAAETIAYKNGFYASFDPKPVENQPGSGLHINVSVKDKDGKDIFESFVAGVLEYVRDMTLVFNPTESSFERLGKMKAPKKITCGKEDRTALIRLPATKGEKRFELRSPDGGANVYLAYALLIYAGVSGVEKGLRLENKEYGELPSSLEEAKRAFTSSEFIKEHLSKKVVEAVLLRE